MSAMRRRNATPAELASAAIDMDRVLEREPQLGDFGFGVYDPRSKTPEERVDDLRRNREDIEVFCAHDADAAGTMIYQTLQEETRARGARKIKIINIGLEPWEAVGMGLEVETLKVEPDARRKPVANYVLAHHDDDDWDDWLQTHRVELNAMTTPQLIEWLGEKMATCGSGKLIPPNDVLEDTFAEMIEKRLRTEMSERILREANLDGQVAEAVAALDPPDGEALRRDIESHFEDDPEAEWRAVVEAAANEPS